MTKTKFTSALLSLALALPLSGCFALSHTVGQGAQGNQTQEKRVWYALWGLVPITDFDSHELAGGAQNYTVESEWTIVDILLGLITGWVTIRSQTVTVTK